MDEVEKVKSKTDVVEIIEEYIPLKHAGRNFKAICPFHNEKSPSFMVSPERQSWHCFGCNKGGDVFSFIQEYDKIDFPEALKYLAERAGVKLSAPVHRTEQEKKKNSLFEVNHLASLFYNYLLLEHKVGKKALQYLTEKRKLPEPLVKKFGIGYAPHGTNMLSAYLMKKKGYTAEEIVEAGLASNQYGRVQDFFFGRIVFPIQDIRGNIIGFSGRALDDETLPKYVNTRETKLYKKSDSLYGIFQAKDEIRTQKRAILVEGEFDVLSSFREGISNIVAVKGTALTIEQIKLLKRFAEKISFCFDTDPAGTAAQRRSIQLIENEKITASVIIPPEGKDPDELLNSDPSAFKNAIKNDVNIYEYIIRTALKTHNPKTADGKRKILDDTLPYLSIIENDVIKEHYLKKLAEQIDSSYDSVEKQSQKLIKPPKREEAPVMVRRQKNRSETLEQYLLALLIQNVKPLEAARKIKYNFAGITLTGDAYSKVLGHLLAYDALEFSIPDFIKQLPHELHPAFDACFLFPIPTFDDEADTDRELMKTAADLRNIIIREKLHALEADIRKLEKDDNEAELTKLYTEFSALATLLKQTPQTRN